VLSSATLYLAVYAMVYHFISTDMKQRALAMLQEGWEATDIADALDVSRRSIGRWEDDFA